MTLRHRLYQWLDHRHPSLASRLVDLSIMALIGLNVIEVILESVPEYEQAYRFWFASFEFVSVFLFALEYCLRVWCCVENPAFSHPLWGRLRYMRTPMALVDLLAFLPSMLVWFGLSLDTRFLRVLRLIRIFKLTRYSDALDLLLTVIRREASAFISAVFIMLIIIIFAASGIYLVEHDAQPEAFGSIPKAIWWATVTLTTVGYGDVVPVTVWGKAFGVLITIAGVGMAAMPAGILASGFSTELQNRREKYRLKLRQALADGVISRAEYEALKAAREELGLEEEDAELLLDEEKSLVQRGKVLTCPHCGQPLSPSQLQDAPSGLE
ncbi:voltage-gated potassium channel [Methylomarinovum tepidoasis]|uniref:Voltage-gated potassium channel n=1 Tax=Methylomarinovum tepidoasis TaxID=2840183 RepID=A0AAU9C6F5_9GAMM|nr:ion transporter [Methylomarinovum sp. IN45]BCX88774.1 voltage-gated potassium channel [Methylomarinovum sp. IN45]